MPETHTEATPAQVAAFVAAAHRAPPVCPLDPYASRLVPAFQIDGEFVAYASPDSTYLVTKRFFDGARRTLLIGMYDFNAAYIQQLALDARARGVAVTVLWDLDDADNPGAAAVFATLRAAGCTCVLAPSCRGAAAAHLFPVSHQKVVVVDDEWTLVQSGNYSPVSIPENLDEHAGPATFVPGQRDMGVAVRSPELAAFFTAMIQADIALETTAATHPAAAARTLAPAEAAVALALAPPVHIPRHFPHREFVPPAPIAVQPVLSPDNYMSVILPFVAGATESLYLEQQYIRAGQAHVADLCAAIAAARRAHPHLDVRIIVAPPFTAADKDRQTLEADLAVLAGTYDLHLGPQVRLLPHIYFPHCHNKLIVVDGRAVLISSQNWSKPGVSQNREAGLLMAYPALAAYYAEIFAYDWHIAARTLPAAPPQLLVPAPAPAPAARDLAPAAVPPAARPVPLNPGDFAEV